MTDLKAEHQRPEGRLIETAMAGPPKISARELARRIGMSDARVRQIINGYASQAGQVLTVVGPADTLARMARAVGVTADQMDEAGRSDAAESMTNLRQLAILPDGALWLQSPTDAWKILSDWVSLPTETRPEQPPIEVLRLWTWDQLLGAAQAQVEDSLDLLRFSIEALSRSRSTTGGRDEDLSEPSDRTDGSLAALEMEEPIGRRYGHDENA